ncbi:hypothetical protein PVAP13_1KG247033 [Panicum virgatum]|uniref:Uncharacterized protein n=1 Tax=Panicum virgatum TaxID=38727 RepID=A0A8T0X7F3_PANVG|nr:hypothetical protein PVAP13_1KG247033 [Panicum virgatum]
MIAASARLLSIETGIAPSPAMSRYDDHNGHPALDFVPGRPLVDEPAVECPDEPPGVWIHAPRGPATAVVSPQPPCNNLKLADFDAQGQKDLLVLASILAFGVALPFVLSP